MNEKMTILLVEDNPDDVELTKIALSQAKVQSEIVVAQNGIEALDYLFGTGRYAGRDLRIMPAVTLLDLKLPKVDGLEVLRCIRTDQRTNVLPVVILTSSREEQDVMSTYRLGANSFIRKPVDFEQFTDAMQQLGLYWLLLNEKPWQGTKKKSHGN